MELELLISGVSSGKSTRNLAILCGCSQSNIRYWLRKEGLKTDFVNYSNYKYNIECKQCKNIFDGKGRFCSNVCKSKYYYYLDNNNSGKTAKNQSGNNKKKRLVEYLGGCCQICGYKKNFKALDFHHKIPSDKTFTISSKHNGPYEVLLEEVKKCMLLCRNCHAELHNPDCLL